jgi:type IV secretory pathway VirJ component
VRDFDVCRTVTNNGKEYSVKDAVERLRQIAERNGITVGASRLLDRALQGATIEEDHFNDEEDMTVIDETAITESEGAASPESTKESAVSETTPKKKRIRKSRAKAAVAAEAAVKKTAAAPKAKTNGAAKTNGKRTHRDFAEEVLPIIVKEFTKLDNPKKRPRGFGASTMQVLMRKLNVPKNTADQYYWKAIWDHPKELGLK